MACFHRFAGLMLPALASSAVLSGAFASGCAGTGASPETVVPVPGDDSGTTTGKDTGSTTPSGDGATTMTGGGDSGVTTDDATTLNGDDSGDVGEDAATMTGKDSGTAADTGTATTGGDSGTSTSWGTPVSGGPSGTGASATVTVNPNSTVGTVGAGFAGFSYEKTHITNDSLTSSNAALVALYKLVGSPVMRLGANDVDNCNWGGTGPEPSAPSGQPFSKTITTGMVDQLCGFLAATGSTIIYGVNYQSDNVTASAAEAAYAEGKCGSSIYGFEIGNELNYFGSWTAVKPEWEAFATAIVATPGALLIGPAASGGDALSLSTPFAENESAKFGSKLILLTQHYYAGSAGSSEATAARLQTPDPYASTSEQGLIGSETTMHSAAVSNNIPNGYRLGECNTFNHHGQMGISDTLIAGLWSIDLMFVTAQHGGSGVNLHGGETGMDGTVPFYYEPIMENKGVVIGVQPVYYGMLLFYLAGRGSVLSTTTSTSSADFTAYSLKASGWTSVVLDNKNATSGVNATVNLGAAVSSASAIYLEGTPAATLNVAATSVTLAGGKVSTAGVWNRNAPYIQTTSGNTVSVYVPPASAALVRVLQ
jgi:hypothetical protein